MSETPADPIPTDTTISGSDPAATDTASPAPDPASTTQPAVQPGDLVSAQVAPWPGADPVRVVGLVHRVGEDTVTVSRVELITIPAGDAQPYGG